MKKTPYRIISIASAVCAVILILISYYSVGVIDRSKMRKAADVRLELICDKMEIASEEAVSAMKQLHSNYKSKARVVAMMLSKTPEILNDEASLEELRVVVGANIISIANNQGIIEYSTDMSGGKKKAHQEFFEAINDKVFSETIVNSSDGKTVIIAGSARLDEDGIVQIEFSPDALERLINNNSFSSYITDVPSFMEGSMAIIDSETYRYISHTNTALNGSAVQFPLEEFSKEKGWFNSEYNGSKSLIQYRKSGSKIVIGIIPYSEIYIRRNSVVKWVAISCLIITVVLILTIRQRTINSNRS